jgi:recombination protein RecT
MSKKVTDELKSALAPAKAEQAPQNGIMVTMERQKGEIQRALPRGMDVDRFLRIALTTVRTNKDLARIAERNPISIVAACMLSAQLGLEPGPLGHAYIVPYGNEAQFQIGYKGIIKLARNSGELKSIEARAVMPSDHFEHEYGLNPKLIHRPNWEDQSGSPALFYGIAHQVNGGAFPLVVTPDEIEEHRRRSKAANKGPWVTDRRSMELKTVVRIMQPWLPLSPESQMAILADGAVSVDLSPHMAEEAAAAQEVIDLESDEVSFDTPSEDVEEDIPNGEPFE